MWDQERKGTLHRFAVIGSLTERGGRITSGSGNSLCGLPIACVGDIVTYPDGAEAVITDGAGYAAVIDNRSAALVGSRLSNGDRIIETLWAELDAGVFEEENAHIEGLFDPTWAPPPREPLHRFAVSGATTAKGGVLQETTSTWEVRGTQRNAGRIGDTVQYADGTTARIITGIGIPGTPVHAYAAVGSLLDNGDMITDSPHREPQISTLFVPVNADGVAIVLQ